MPWEEITVIEARWRLLEAWQREEESLERLCEQYGVSRKTAYKWRGRYLDEGLEGLQDRSRAPLHQPGRVDAEIEARIVELRREHPHWGAAKLRGRLLAAGEAAPAASTIGEILKRRGLTQPLLRHRRVEPNPAPLTVPEEPNHVWAADYKGWFRTQDGQRCDPLTITDSYSRFLFCCQLVPGLDEASARRHFADCFARYGVPRVIRADNGPPFAAPGMTGLSRLAVWWIKLGIRPERILAGKPQQNGRHERFHRTLKQAVASPPAATPAAQQERMDRFAAVYNYERPHQALGQQTPAQWYRPVPAAAPVPAPTDAYTELFRVRKVNGGQVRWGPHKIHISHALEGEYVGLEPIPERYWRVCFSFCPIGLLDSRLLRLVHLTPRLRAELNL